MAPYTYRLPAPHDVRIAKSKNFEGLVVGSDGLLCRREQKGPPDLHTYIECFAVHECFLIMAKMANPRRIGGYYKKQKKLAKHNGTCWALQHQTDDRWRHEQLHDLHRRESKKYDRRASPAIGPDPLGASPSSTPTSRFTISCGWRSTAKGRTAGGRRISFG